MKMAIWLSAKRIDNLWLKRGLSIAPNVLRLCVRLRSVGIERSGSYRNSKNYRTGFKQRLENEIVNSVIKCDEENNPPEAVYFCCLVAKVSWIENHQEKYCDLIFGQPKQAIILQQKLLTN
jgi:hypothetical protein